MTTLSTEAGLGLARVMQVGTALYGSKALFAATRLDLFTALADGATTEAELAARLGLRSPGLGDLLGALAGLGVLERSGDSYGLAPGTAPFLVRDSPAYLGGFLDWAGSAWDELPELLRTGATPAAATALDELPRRGADGGVGLDDIVAGIDTLNAAVAPALAHAIDWAPYSSVVDVDGACGGLVEALIALRPQLTGTVLADPEFEPYFAARAAEGVAFVARGPGAPVVPEADVVLVGGVLHDTDPAERAGLVAAAARAVRPGGALLVYDPMLDPVKPGTMSYLMSLQMRVTTRSGGEYPRTEAEGWIAAAGFAVKEIRTLLTDTLLVAHAA